MWPSIDTIGGWRTTLGVVALAGAGLMATAGIWALARLDVGTGTSFTAPPAAMAPTDDLEPSAWNVVLWPGPAAASTPLPVPESWPVLSALLVRDGIPTAALLLPGDGRLHFVQAGQALEHYHIDAIDPSGMSLSLGAQQHRLELHR